MRRVPLVLAVATLSLVLGLGPAPAQTASSLPGVPAGQGGPDSGVNQSSGGNATGGDNIPSANAGPATSTDEGSSLIPWLIGAAVIVLLGAGGALVARRASVGRDPSCSG